MRQRTMTKCRHAMQSGSINEVLSPQAGSNHRPFAYEASALPLSYKGFFCALGDIQTYK